MSNKASPPYWRLFRLLQFLKLGYKEYDRNSNSHRVVVKDFGIVFVFNKNSYFGSKYSGWEVITLNPEDLELYEAKFKEELMWSLISRGYMAYLRSLGSAGSQFFKNLLVRNGWGQKIMDKRLEIYKTNPQYRFLYKLNQEMSTAPISRVLMHYPDFFDYLV